MTTLRELLASEQAGIAEIAEFLDRAGAPQRLEAAHSLDRAAQRELYRRAAAAAPLTLEHFVPREVPDMQPVHHMGRNTLPLPPALKLFEKRFVRPRDGSARLFGYNESLPNRWIGPGYFVARSTREEPSWIERGAVVVDYVLTPEGEMPAQWPKLVPNSHGLQRFVFYGTRDFMRRVSHHVSIGAAYKGEKALGHYFILVRQE
ncbi:MAG TPA: hypothetical protein VJV78_17550 [Polyangiales bacterium]|nr:hypothetical protein [Polyangiales bacterium]